MPFTSLTWKSWWKTLGAWGPIDAAIERYGDAADRARSRVNELVNAIVLHKDPFQIGIEIEYTFGAGVLKAAESLETERFISAVELATFLTERGHDALEPLHRILPDLSLSAGDEQWAAALSAARHFAGKTEPAEALGSQPVDEFLLGLRRLLALRGACFERDLSEFETFALRRPPPYAGLLDAAATVGGPEDFWGIVREIEAFAAGVGVKARWLREQGSGFAARAGPEPLRFRDNLAALGRLAAALEAVETKSSHNEDYPKKFCEHALPVAVEAAKKPGEFPGNVAALEEAYRRVSSHPDLNWAHLWTEKIAKLAREVIELRGKGEDYDIEIIQEEGHAGPSPHRFLKVGGSIVPEQVYFRTREQEVVIVPKKRRRR